MPLGWLAHAVLERSDGVNREIAAGTMLLDRAF
jgi:hypothetical protein